MLLCFNLEIFQKFLLVPITYPLRIFFVSGVFVKKKDNKYLLDHFLTANTKFFTRFFEFFSSYKNVNFYLTFLLQTL